jgi:hypothetical protein
MHRQSHNHNVHSCIRNDSVYIKMAFSLLFTLHIAPLLHITLLRNSLPAAALQVDEVHEEWKED